MNYHIPEGKEYKNSELTQLLIKFISYILIYRIKSLPNLLQEQVTPEYSG